MKWPVSGNTTIGGAGATVGDHLESSNAVYLLGVSNTPGRILWLRSFGYYYNSTRIYAVGLMDSAAGVTVCSATISTLRYVAHSTATQLTAQGNTCQITFAEPGLKFSTSCSVALCSVVAGTQSGTGVLKCWGAGYEE